MKKSAFGAALVCAFGLAQADLPTAAQVQKNMGMGFNIGNTLEVPNNPEGWGNAFPTQALLDSIKAAGFNTVRLPCAWDSHAPGGKITETWLDSVKTVVDFAMRAGLYTVLNIHHEGEGGWFQTHIGTSVDNGVNTKMKNYWTQIANKFKNYDEHLLFAGANEPGSNIDNWSAGHVNTLKTYYQTFIDAVRATGGNNATRTLIIQGLNTDIDKSVANFTTASFPKDTKTGYLMFEVHYYDPYQYTLMYEEQDWGAGEMIIPQYYYGDYRKAGEPKRNAGYNAWAKSVDEKLASIEHTNEQFAKMKSNYVEKGYPVLVGEFGANHRAPNLNGNDLNLSNQGRVQWHKDVVTSAKKYGLTPVLWDMGNESNTGYDNMAYIRHNKSGVGTMGKVVDVDVINAMRQAMGLGKYENKGITHQDNLVPGNGPVVSSSNSVTPRSSASVNPNSSTAVATSSATTTCKALTTECYSEAELCQMGIAQFCNNAMIIATNAANIAKTSLIREGDMLRATANLGSDRRADRNSASRADIRLFDMNGNQVRVAHANGANTAELSLAGLHKGTYIAKSGTTTLKVSIK